MSDFASTNMGVKAALSKMSLTEEVKKYIVSNQSNWQNFGKMTSHLYREKLMKMMEANNLTQESKFMVFFFFSVIKNQPRVLKAMTEMPQEVKNMPWFNGTRDFIASHVTQYVTATVGNSKFPAVNIPTCNPGVDILVYCLITNPNDKTIENLKNRTTFAQLNLDDEMQNVAKTGYEHYWNNIVQGTKNTVKNEEPKMRIEYYNTSANDKYLLVDEKLKEVQPESMSKGYTRKEIENYLKALK